MTNTTVPTPPERTNLGVWVAAGLALTGVGIVLAIPVGVVISIIEGNAYGKALAAYCAEMEALGLEPDLS